MMMRGSDIMQ